MSEPVRPSVGEGDDAINVSALNQYGYCPRRCGLIYLEGEFSQNIHTARGNAEHERVDQAAHLAGRDGARVEYALPIWSETLGLIGKCDVVEFWPDGGIFPVEYKHGPRRRRVNDDLQLVAQAMCLAEMFARPVPQGAIYHAASRHRREVTVTDALRASVVQAIAAIRAMLRAGELPAAVNDGRCHECSLRETCGPDLVATPSGYRRALGSLFDPDANGV